MLCHVMSYLINHMSRDAMQCNVMELMINISHRMYTICTSIPNTPIARGPTNFGWDPIFQPDGYDLTYAELSKEIKNQISHRARSLDMMKTYFAQNPDILRVKQGEET